MGGVWVNEAEQLSWPLWIAQDIDRTSKGSYLYQSTSPNL